MDDEPLTRVLICNSSVAIVPSLSASNSSKAATLAFSALFSSSKAAIEDIFSGCDGDSVRGRSRKV